MPSNIHHIQKPLTRNLEAPRDPARLEVNLDTAGRSQIVTAACLMLYRDHRTAEIGDWRHKAADWSLPELLHEAAELGVRFQSGGHPFTLPQQVTPIRSWRP